MKELLLSPAHRWAMVLGKMLGAFVVSLMSVVILLGVLIFVIGVRPDNWGEVIGFSLLTLLIFIAGLLVSNTVITMGSTLGYLRASKNFAIYATVAVITGVFSLTIGTIFVLGRTSMLPAIFGG